MLNLVSDPQDAHIFEKQTDNSMILSEPPMLFVVHPSGDGFEILDSSAFDLELLTLDPTTTTKDIYEMPPNQTALPFPVPLGSHAITLVSTHKVVDAQIPPLPLAVDRKPYHRPYNLTDRLSCLKRPSTIQSDAWDSLNGKYTLTMPRATGQKVPIKKTNTKPVVVFREVVKVPPWEEGSITRLEDQMSKLETSQTQDENMGQVLLL